MDLLESQQGKNRDGINIGGIIRGIDGGFHRNYGACLITGDELASVGLQ